MSHKFNSSTTDRHSTFLPTCVGTRSSDLSDLERVPTHLPFVNKGVRTDLSQAITPTPPGTIVQIGLDGTSLRLPPRKRRLVGSQLNSTGYQSNFSLPGIVDPERYCATERRPSEQVLSFNIKKRTVNLDTIN